MGLSNANITGNEDEGFAISYRDGDEGRNETGFRTFQEASQRLQDLEVEHNDTPERAASEMTPEDAEEINSNVNVPHIPGAQTGGNNLDENDPRHDPGSGNREAPHMTKETANDDKDE